MDSQNQRLELLDHQRQQQLRHDPDAEEEAAFPTSPPRTTLADLHKEERMIRELEQKKRVLGERVTQLDSSLQQS